MIDPKLAKEIDKILSSESANAAVVAVEGPIGGGKTSAAGDVRDYVGHDEVMVLSTDAYILVSRHRWDEFYEKADRICLHEWYDLDKIRFTLHEARQRKPFDINGLYNLSNGQHDLTVHHDTTHTKIVVLEGLFALDKSLLDEIDVKVFIDVDRKIALERARLRDQVERNIDDETWKKKEAIYYHGYNKYHDKHRSLADVIITHD